MPVVLTALAMSLTACQDSRPLDEPLVRPQTAPAPVSESFATAAARQREAAAELVVLRNELSRFATRGTWRERGYFNGSENDSIEGFLLRLVALHSALWGEAERWGGTALALAGGDDRPRAHTLVSHAGWAMADSGSFLVAAFAGDAVAIAKLNEAFYRSEIAAGTYDRLELAFTSDKRDAELGAAWRLHERELRDPTSPLAKLRFTDAVAAALLEETAGLYARAAKQITLIREQAPGGALYEKSRHERVATLGREALAELGEAGYASRALLFKDVSRIKKPGAHTIRFSADDKRTLHALLQPGDVILTYTAGYISDVFIPGVFKHAITYVGGADERAAVGVSITDAPSFAEPEAARLQESLATDTLADGTPADLIEAVAEGVKFSNLDHILDTHVNRLVVLRPVLADDERAAFVAGVFAFVGDAYDFRFDFVDASRQVCTEVVYRALGDKGGIDFTLTERAGHPTLSADDIVAYELTSVDTRFEILLYAEEDADARDHRARLWTGPAARAALAARMEDTTSEARAAVSAPAGASESR